MTVFVTRLISGVILVAVALITIIAGGPVLMVTLAAVSLIGMGELYRAVGVEETGKISLLSLAGYAGALLFDLLLYFQLSAYTMVGLMGALILLMAVYVFTYPRYRAEQVMAAFFGLIYVAVMLSYIYQTRNLPDGAFLVWLIFLCSWGCDTCAYCVGMLIGKHKMSPRLSPKKSVE